MVSSNRKSSVPIGSNITPNGDGQLGDAKYAAFAQRLRDAADRKGFTAAKLAKRLNMTSGTLSRYWNGDRLPPADALIEMAEALDEDPTRLVSGRQPLNRPALVDVSDAEFVRIPRYDLRDVTETGKGPRVDETPFRKDWLTRTLGTSSELYLATLLSDYPSRRLYEGDLVFCREIEAHEIAEGNICLFMLDRRVVIARFSLKPAIAIAQGAAAPIAARYSLNAGEDEDLVLTVGEIGNGEGLYAPIARILGKWIQRL